MKILRLSAMALAAALGCSVGCGGSSCGGTNINQNTNAPQISCGPGTQQVNGVCVLTSGTHSK
jgi:hypothetical protein